VSSTDEYLATIGRMEPDITAVDTPPALASIAISLKRIADALETQTRLQGLTLRAHDDILVRQSAVEILQLAGLEPWTPER